jgi:LmbE family N-acetylglucosaminyl deacetylase
MAIVHILAHFDDEYAALPLVRARAKAGLDQWFLYVADYATPQLGARRLAETRALLTHLGIDPARAISVGSGVTDGRLHQAVSPAYAALAAAVADIGPVERLVCAAWEGGHPDHDLCAAAAVRLSQSLAGAPPIDQFALYHGRRLPGPLFAACDPIPENGPTQAVAASAADWLDHAAAVRFFPSQARTWAGLWPSMFATFARRGFTYQALDPDRVRHRPHAGPLLYERRFGVDYATVRAAADHLLDGV